MGTWLIWIGYLGFRLVFGTMGCIMGVIGCTIYGCGALIYDLVTARSREDAIVAVKHFIFCLAFAVAWAIAIFNFRTREDLRCLAD